MSVWENVNFFHCICCTFFRNNKPVAMFYYWFSLSFDSLPPGNISISPMVFVSKAKKLKISYFCTKILITKKSESETRYYITIDCSTCTISHCWIDWSDMRAVCCWSLSRINLCRMVYFVNATKQSVTQNATLRITEFQRLQTRLVLDNFKYLRSAKIKEFVKFIFSVRVFNKSTCCCFSKNMPPCSTNMSLTITVQR